MNSDFGDRRRAYFERLYRREDVVSRYFLEEEKKGRLWEIMLFPEDDRELAIASSTLMLCEDYIRTKVFAKYGVLKPIDVHDCMVNDYYSAIIEGVFGDSSIEEIRKELLPFMNDKWGALRYEFLVMNSLYNEEFIFALEERTSISLSNEIIHMQFNLLLEKVQRGFMPNDNMDKLPFWARDFHECLEENILTDSANYEYALEKIDDLLDENRFEDKHRTYHR